MINKHDLARDFSALLDKQENEQVYQSFLEKHPFFIPREFVQNHGIHFNLALKKLSLAKDYVTDFFYLSKSSDDWNCVLVELEKPQSRFFKDGSNEFHQDFVSALSQIRRWRAWFEENTNKEHFINNTLRTVRIPTPMAKNPCYIKYVLVHGRRAEYQDNHIRAGQIRAEERDDFKIMTYDSLLEGINSKGDLYIGVKTNEHVDIISDRFVDESIFSWIAPSAIRITEALKTDALNHKSAWYHYKTISGSRVLALDDVLPKIQTKG
ncbi:MAG: DUF4263 domain-containing protein [Leptospiraceae bacterium]|nr:DUF4263 domain-containing protein [Leptospiraceae bacterium]